MNYKQRKARRIKIAKRTKWHSSKKCKNYREFVVDKVLSERIESLDRKAKAKRAARNTNIRLAIYFILLVLLVCYVVSG